jgi:hypothetical protein
VPPIYITFGNVERVYKWQSKTACLRNENGPDKNDQDLICIFLLLNFGANPTLSINLKCMRRFYHASITTDFWGEIEFADKV